MARGRFRREKINVRPGGNCVVEVKVGGKEIEEEKR